MIKVFQISSLENIMPKYGQDFTPISEISILKGERASYQIAYAMDNSTEYGYKYEFNLESDIKEHLKIYKVGYVPVVKAVHTQRAMKDDNYISTEGGMYPDILYPVDDNIDDNIIKEEFYFQGIWIETDDKIPVGEHKIKITISTDDESVSTTLKLEVLNLELPPQELVYSLNVHGDCIANYYNMEVFSEEFWTMLEKFIKISAEYGSNMLMVPVITPPLDTQVGGERMTVQLVDISKDGDKYTFDFSKFKRFIDICRNAGIKCFEMPQFFTQWGAEFAPKIMAFENGEYKRIFGWETESTDESYLNFLSQFIPHLIKSIKENGIENDVVFAVSDEPFGTEAVNRYAKLAEFLNPYLKGFKTIDPFMNYAHYEKSGVDIPIIYNDCIEEFEGKISEYNICYCCVQDYEVSNRFIAMPLYRNRCFGYQLYKYDVKGFFHWALNFYNSRLSIRPINPFFETDADGGFPGGDAFSVYPAENGPIPSMRIIVFNEALQDLRVLKLLEKYIGRDETIKLIENITGEITFKNCAKSVRTILDIREKVINKLKEFIK